jgi:hypothetical protein
VARESQPATNSTTGTTNASSIVVHATHDTTHDTRHTSDNTHDDTTHDTHGLDEAWPREEGATPHTGHAMHAPVMARERAMKMGPAGRCSHRMMASSARCIHASHASGNLTTTANAAAAAPAQTK